MPTPIFSKPERKVDRINTISNRKITFRISIQAKRSDVDNITMGELKQLKKNIAIQLNSITAKDLLELSRKSIKGVTKIPIKIRIEVI